MTEHDVADRIVIRDLKVSCIIGIEPKERDIKQNVLINIAMSCNLERAGRSDQISDTVDYKTLKNELVEFVERSRFNLIERLGEGVADICLNNRLVDSVRVTVDKPGALTGARSVAIEIVRPKR